MSVHAAVCSMQRDKEAGCRLPATCTGSCAAAACNNRGACGMSAGSQSQRSLVPWPVPRQIPQYPEPSQFPVYKALTHSLADQLGTSCH
jgi:hypothetical protein